MPVDIQKTCLEAPRSLEMSMARAIAANLVRSLPPRSKLSRKLLRIIYGEKFKHMSIAGAAFRLQPTAHPQVWEIFWKGEKLGETHPFPETETLVKDDIWVLATGPSVKELDLSRLKDKKVMGVNGAIAICQQHGIVPTYYASSDHNFFSDRMDLVKEAIASGAHCFFSFNGLARICERAPELIATGKISFFEIVNRYYGIPRIDSNDLLRCGSNDPDLLISDNNPKVGWSHDIRKGVFAAKTITYSACQIANFLQARNIFILGMDLGNPQGQPIRAYESGPQACNSSLFKDYEKTILPSFQFLSQLNLPTRVWNLSLNSRLPNDVIPKLSFENALNLQLADDK